MVIPYRTSAPKLPSNSSPVRNGLPSCSGLSACCATRYGSTSRRRGGSIPWIPTRSPNSDTHPDASFGIGFHCTVSFLRWINRSMLNPHTSSGSSEKRSCENGIRNSAVHPSSSTSVATSHTAFHESSSFVSSNR